MNTTNMKTHKEKVQEYVREQIPALKELSKGCQLKNKASGYYTGDHLGYDRTTGNSLVVSKDGTYVWKFKALGNFTVGDWKPSEMGKHGLADFTIIGHPIQLHHYLAVLGGRYVLDTDGCLYRGKDYNEAFDMPDCVMSFSLTTGQPATEKDWEILANILGV